MDASVQALSRKITIFKPEAVCIVGKSIWESIFRVRKGRGVKKEEFRYGWQDENWEGARVFVATSTSGLAAGMSRVEKERVWRELGVWVEERRRLGGLRGSASET
jgi:G:T/U-mismatch repair DNA glycosylase